jgi:hypothetical protein
MDHADLVIAVRDELQACFDRLGCISATAALCDVVEALGMRALRPLTVRAFIFNPALTERVGDFLAPDAAPLLWRVWAEESGFVRVDLGMGEAPAGEWAGHLVAVGQEGDSRKRLVFDATIQQADQPTHNIVLRPILLRVDAQHLEGRGCFRTRVNGCEILYKAIPNDGFFEHTPIWCNKEQRLRVRDRVLKRLQATRAPQGD